jgi:hypothetical protein
MDTSASDTAIPTLGGALRAELAIDQRLHTGDTGNLVVIPEVVGAIGG